MPSATVRCHVSSERRHNRVPTASDYRSEHEALHQLTFAGRSRMASPAGEHNVALLTFTAGGGDGSPPAEGRVEIIEDLGISTRLSVNFGPPGHGTALREILKIGP